MSSSSFTQTRFRIRNDDGNETTATWIAAENTNPASNINTGTRFRVRFQVDETASVAWTNITWNLRYSLNAAAYAAVTAATPIQFSASANFADGDDSTSQLTAATGTFVTNNNAMKETTGGALNSGTSGQYFDTEWSVILDAAQLTQGDTIALRIYNGNSAIAAYTQTPTITVQDITNGVLSKTLDAITLSSAGTNTDNGALSSTIAAITLASAGTNTDNGALAQTIDAITLLATSTNTVNGLLSATLDAVALASDGTVSGGATPVVARPPGGAGYPVYGKPAYKKKRFNQIIDEWFEAYKELEKIPEVKEAAAEIVRPYAKTQASIPKPKSIDWQAFAKDVQRTRELIELWQRQTEDRATLEDDEEVALWG